jgi:hypothetical protein
MLKQLPNPALQRTGRVTRPAAEVRTLGVACPTPPRWSPGSAVLICLAGTALIPRLRSGFRQPAQTRAKRLNFGGRRIPSRGPDRHSIWAGCQLPTRFRAYRRRLGSDCPLSLSVTCCAMLIPFQCSCRADRKGVEILPGGNASKTLRQDLVACLRQERDELDASAAQLRANAVGWHRSRARFSHILCIFLTNYARSHRMWAGGVCAQSQRGSKGVKRGWKKLVTD